MKQVRVRVIELHKKGIKPKDIATKVKCSIAYVYGVVAGYKRLNEIEEMNNKADTQYRLSRVDGVMKKVRMLGAYTSTKPIVDNVNHPDHYKSGGIETIDFIEAKKLDYHLGNVVKYITRSDLKGNKLEDLQKAQWYLNRAISNLAK